MNPFLLVQTVRKPPKLICIILPLKIVKVPTTGNPYWRVRLSAVNILVLTSLDKLLSMLHLELFTFLRTSYLNEGVNCSEPSPGRSKNCVRLSWLLRMHRTEGIHQRNFELIRFGFKIVYSHIRLSRNSYKNVTKNLLEQPDRPGRLRRSCWGRSFCGPGHRGWWSVSFQSQNMRDRLQPFYPCLALKIKNSYFDTFKYTKS
jgi:hypothetical protein